MSRTLRQTISVWLVMAGMACAACTPLASDASQGPTGSLVYRNSGVAAVYNFATGKENTFDPGDHPFIDPGMAVSRQGVVSTALNADSDRISVGLFGLDGKSMGTLNFDRDLPSQNGAAVFNRDSSLMAISVNEPRSAQDDERIDRTIVMTVPGAKVVATLDGFADPYWAGSRDGLIVHELETGALYLFDSQYQNKGRVGDISTPFIGGYSVSADGRYVVYDPNDHRIIAFDRDTNKSWVAASDRVSYLHNPVLSPDGKFLAMIARDRIVATPHIVPFSPGRTVDVDSNIHGLQHTLAECEGRMGWI
jgi:hypothetical protein